MLHDYLLYVKFSPFIWLSHFIARILTLNNIKKHSMILDWKQLSREIYSSLKDEIAWFDRPPSLGVVLVGDNPSSLKYIKQKKKWAEKIGITFNMTKFEDTITEGELLDNINALNNDNNVDGYIIQLPLPAHFDRLKIINSIDPKKDVDGFTCSNFWKFALEDYSWFLPCTPAWIIEILKKYSIDIVWKNVVVIWRSNIVWKPLSLLLMNLWATVTSCNSKTKDISMFTKQADIVIVAAWCPKLLKSDMVNESTIIIDVWINVVDWKTQGDTDFEAIFDQWNLITPVPWWVGPMTVAMLMKNTVSAYKNNR